MTEPVAPKHPFPAGYYPASKEREVDPRSHCAVRPQTYSSAAYTMPGIPGCGRQQGTQRTKIPACTRLLVYRGERNR